MAAKPLYTVIAVVGIAAASGAAWWYQNKGGASGTAKDPTASAPAVAAPARGIGGAAARPPAVEVARVEVMKLTDDAQTVGSLRSRQSVIVRPEVSGRVTRLGFRDGERVRKGQLLVQLDDQLPLAQVQQARAELSIAQANHRRNQELVAQNFISRRSVEESAAALQVAEAKLALAEATAARLRIVAPFDGVAGIRLVNIGDYLKDGADIVNLEDLDAVYVDFRLPERFQAKVRPGQVAMVQTDVLPGRRWNAVIQAVDPLVDANGRSVGIRGCIDNRSLELRPGMFARVTAVFGQRDDALVVPEEAIVPVSGRQTVIRLVDGPDQDSKIAQRVEVKTGIRQPGRVEILEGLKAGDLVVTAGQQRVQRDGMPVRVLELGTGGRPGGGAAAAAAEAPANGVPVAAPAAVRDGVPAKGAPVVQRPSAAANRPATTSVAGAGPRPAGPNPCTVHVSDAGAARNLSRPGAVAPMPPASAN